MEEHRDICSGDQKCHYIQMTVMKRKWND